MVLPKLAIVILSKFLNIFWKLIISMTPTYKELYTKELYNNDAWHLLSLIFSIGGATSSTSTESRSTLRQNEIGDCKNARECTR